MMQRTKVFSSDLLLVVDVQNDFCRGGALEVPGGDEVVPVINRLAGGFVHVGLTQDWHPRGHVSFASSHAGKQPLQTLVLPYGDQILWPDHCISGTRGAEFHPGLHTVQAEVIIRKGFHPAIDSYSAFYENDHETPTGLAGYLRNRGLKRLFMAGLALDFCVLYSALDARKESFEVFVIEEAVRGINVDGSMEKAWKAMGGAGIHRISRRDLSF
ncbi:MAG: bifunctional nicotinamidase/pyrazinamidase [Acidobacteriia bacterium]|nr:bifunctional nicotinamidase/pyrazinamidase [Terriglobia bacterium]